MALERLGNTEEALKVYEEGLKYDPNNAQIKQGIESCKQSANDPMFGPQAMAKLMSNPKTAAFF